MTVEAFLLDWLDRDVPKFVRSVNTLDHYAWAVREHLVPALGKHRLATLTPDHVDELLEGRIEAGAGEEPLTPAEARALLAAVKDDRLEALVVLGLAMGLRPGELTGLPWPDVDLATGVVHMRQTLKRERNRPVVGGLKTERSRRSWPARPSSSAR